MVATYGQGYDDGMAEAQAKYDERCAALEAEIERLRTRLATMEREVDEFGDRVCACWSLLENDGDAA